MIYPLLPKRSYLKPQALYTNSIILCLVLVLLSIGESFQSLEFLLVGIEGPNISDIGVWRVRWLLINTVVQISEITLTRLTKLVHTYLVSNLA